MRYRIRPFKKDGMWMFTDIGVNLENEPLVQGIDAMIEELTASIPDAETGFEMVFADEPFAGAQVSLEWIRADEIEGNWYRCPEFALDGWLCPALGKYFADPPKHLFIQAKFLRKPYVYSYPLSMREPHRVATTLERHGLPKPPPSKPIEELTPDEVEFAAYVASLRAMKHGPEK